MSPSLRVFGVLLSLAFVAAVALAHDQTLRFSGILNGKSKTVAPTFSSQGLQCTAGTTAESEFDTVAFTVETAPTSYFIRVMFSDNINTQASVRVSTGRESNGCAGVLRGASSQNVAPSVQFVQWISQNGTYYVTVQASSPLSSQDGLYAMSIDEATTTANTADLTTLWNSPSVIATACSEGGESPYAVAQWVPSTSGFFDANVILENPTDANMKSTLSIWACTNPSDKPGNGFSAASIFSTCASNNTNSCTNIAIRQSSLGFNYQDMHVSYGSSALAPRTYFAAGTTYFFMFGADSLSDAATGYAALIIEPTRFSVLQTSTLFTSPHPDAESCSSNVANQANTVFSFTKLAGDNVVLIDTGATDFDSIGSFYSGDNANRETCPTSWISTVDIDGNPIGLAITSELTTVTTVVSPYGGAGNDGWQVQVWAMSGPTYVAPPSVPTDAPTDPPSADTPTTVPSSGNVLVPLGLVAFVFALVMLV